MATASAQPSDYECPICHEHFSTPKILPCAHLLCRQCIVTWLKSDSQATCPICRDVIADSKARAGKSLVDIADALPTDLTMEARVECAAILSKAHKCCCCRNTAATAICLNCGDTLCANCAVFHGNMSMSRHHKVEDLSSMTAEALASSRQVACSVHSDETSKLFCPTHGAAICHLCATSTHRACPEVRDLEKKMEEARGVLGELAATLKAGESKLEGAISQLDEYLSDMEKATQATLANIDLKFDQLSKSMDACRRRLREQAKGPYSEAKKRVEEDKAALLKRRGKAMSYLRLVDRVGDRMPRVCGVSTLPSTLQTAVNSLDLDVNMPTDAKAVRKATLMIVEVAFKRIERELSQLVLGSEGWRLHSKHGGDIVLTNDQQTAERFRGYEDAVVVSRDAMTTSTLYEVRLDATGRNTALRYLVCGVTDGDPTSLTLPTEDPSTWTEAVVIGVDGVRVYGSLTKSDISNHVKDVQVGRQVGVMVDADNKLHLYVDAQDRGVAASNIRRPCHAFFCVRQAYKKITTLPLRIVP